jgi:hypothetical protein
MILEISALFCLRFKVLNYSSIHLDLSLPTQCMMTMSHTHVKGLKTKLQYFAVENY